MQNGVYYFVAATHFIVMVHIIAHRHHASVRNSPTKTSSNYTAIELSKQLFCKDVFPKYNWGVFFNHISKLAFYLLKSISKVFGVINKMIIFRKLQCVCVDFPGHVLKVRKQIQVGPPEPICALLILKKKKEGKDALLILLLPFPENVFFFKDCFQIRCIESFVHGHEKFVRNKHKGFPVFDR